VITHKKEGAKKESDRMTGVNKNRRGRGGEKWDVKSAKILRSKKAFRKSNSILLYFFQWREKKGLRTWGGGEFKGEERFIKNINERRF